MLIDYKLYNRILELREKGLSYKEIRNIVRCANAKISYAIKNKKEVLKNKTEVVEIKPKMSKKDFIKSFFLSNTTLENLMTKYLPKDKSIAERSRHSLIFLYKTLEAMRFSSNFQKWLIDCLQLDDNGLYYYDFGIEPFKEVNRQFFFLYLATKIYEGKYELEPLVLEKDDTKETIKQAKAEYNAMEKNRDKDFKI